VLSPLTASPNTIFQADSTGAPSFQTTGPPGLTFRSVTLQPIAYVNPAALPPVTTANEGQEAFVLNCLNGTQTGGGGTGCPYRVDNTGSWVPYPSIPTLTVTVGGQAIHLGQATVNQGTGSKLPTWSGASVSGNLVSQAADGTLIDSGIASTGGGGGGGSGTVTAGTANQLAYYPGNGPTVAGLASLNNGVLSTDGSGVPAWRTSLPAGMTIPGPTISSPNLTGSGQYGSLTGSGKLTAAGSTTSQAGFNIPLGVAPTTPQNGDIFLTNGGFFQQVNGQSLPIGTGNGTLTGITPSGPITGGGTSGTVPIGCATCLTGTSGGPLQVALPLLFNQTTSTVSLGPTTKTWTFNADQYTTIANAIYTVYLTFPYASGSIIGVNANTGGANSPSYAIGVQVAGSNISSCTNLTVTPSQPVSATCDANSIAKGNLVQVILSGTNGQPSSSVIQVTYSISAS
jgi:hypothetical protein